MPKPPGRASSDAGPPTYGFRSGVDDKAASRGVGRSGAKFRSPATAGGQCIGRPSAVDGHSTESDPESCNTRSKFRRRSVQRDDGSTYRLRTIIVRSDEPGCAENERRLWSPSIAAVARQWSCRTVRPRPPTTTARAAAPADRHAKSSHCRPGRCPSRGLARRRLLEEQRLDHALRQRRVDRQPTRRGPWANTAFHRSERRADNVMGNRPDTGGKCPTSPIQKTKSLLIRYLSPPSMPPGTSEVPAGR